MYLKMNCDMDKKRQKKVIKDASFVKATLESVKKCSPF